MFSPIDVQQQLTQYKNKHRNAQEDVLRQAQEILQNDLFADKKILSHLKDYSRSFAKVDETDVATEDIFTQREIKGIAVRHRLKFLDAKMYRPEMPHTVVLKIKELNVLHRKDLKHFMVLAPPRCFSDPRCEDQSALFASTNCDNYYLIHRWGKSLHWSRQLLFWPLRHFENLVCTLIFFTLVLTLSLPTSLITLDQKAEYWSGYRAAAFFHLLIFNTGFTAYLTFAFARNFSSSVWNRKTDFG